MSKYEELKQLPCKHFRRLTGVKPQTFRENGSHLLGVTDTGYQGINKICLNVILPKKRRKKHPLTREEKQENRKISSKRALNENVIGMLKRFKIISDKYRNRRKRFGLRFNLIAGLYNYEIQEN